jgi:hypothetical protein
MSRSEPTAELRVSAANPAVRITLVGSDLTTLKQGVGDLRAKLPGGIYAARFQAGSSVTEQIVVLRPEEGGAHVRQDEIQFASAAPLERTWTSAEGHQHAAARLSRSVHRKLGRGAGLFVFVRDWDRRTRTNPAVGLTLHAASGEHLLDFEKHGKHGGGDEPAWAGCNVALDPGAYRLRVNGGLGGTTEQTVVAAGGWQVQVFLTRRPDLSTSRGRRADLGGGAILMAPIGRGFDPERDDMHTTELARQSLRDHRADVAEPILRVMLRRKFENPMLGLLGAHLLLQREKPDQKLLAVVVRNLRRILGGHPDVEALDLSLGRRANRVRPFEVPPMLESSWSLIVSATADHPHLVSRDSLAAAAAERVVVGGPWLIWRPPPRRRGRAPTVARPALAQAIAEVATSLPAEAQHPSVALEQSGPAGDLGGVEADVLRYAQKLSSAARGRGVSPEELVDDAAVVETLCVPRAVAEEAVDGVYAQFVK